MQTETHRNGCHTRRDFVTSYPVQDGWYMDGVTRTPRMVSNPHRMAKDCKYTHDKLVGSKDPACAGCPRKATTQPI